ncbi:unnamed protein product [Allacma fusca]|uniref:DUF4789 domain-containing protein n=1 Tax=Allacma fusca TaxID=39272 RepID=A0A8J2KBS3_9HEXA|nr:unnamed protein product [Allacma fusca]
MTVLLLDASPIHSHIVRRETRINRLCADDGLYFERTKKCYRPHENDPCGELLFKPSLSDVEGNIGSCQCPDYDGGEEYRGRPVVPWEEELRCYPIYDQGPCKEGDWLVPKNNSGPSCEKIPCPDKYRALVQESDYSANSSRFVFLHEGKCYLTYSSDSKHLCGPYESLVFINEDSFNFYCDRSVPVGDIQQYDSQGLIPPTDCVDGFERDFQGECKPLTVL